MILQKLLGRKTNRYPWFLDKSYFRMLAHDKPIEEYEFVVLDTELTGLNARHDEIVAIGAVRVHGLRIVASDVFEVFVRPHKALPKNSTLVHRITPQQIKDAPQLADVFPSLMKYLGDSLLVGHCLGLDMTFLNRAAMKLFDSRIYNPCLDTMRLAQIYTENCWERYSARVAPLVSYGLADLSRSYGLPAFTSHDALEDALQTAYLFIFLVRKMQAQGYRTLGELYKAGQIWRWVF